MLDFAYLLESVGLKGRATLLLRHCPTEPALRRLLPSLALEEPELFNLYQRSHGARAEAAVLKADLVAAFIGHTPGRALFVGLYEQCGAEPMTPAQSRQNPGYRKLVSLGLSPWEKVDPRATALMFDLKPLPEMQEWKGKLIVGWPRPDRSWFRRANERNEFPVIAIREESLLIQAMPPWQELCFGWPELSALPKSWQTSLSHWRGIYFIHDRTDGKGYVGAAYGEENILGRWRAYGQQGHGGNVLLRKRDPKNFTFTILERVSPDLPPDDVMKLEASWKLRLHTRHPAGLNAN